MDKKIVYRKEKARFVYRHESYCLQKYVGEKKLFAQTKKQC